ncbi:hypothetical protein [Bradyrhizobium sp. RT4b]|uniref:hypothetical protein n=1 Tax=unclassified Bradyrhizobium TaxID=2631580 RepID=UPI00339978EF
MSNVTPLPADNNGRDGKGRWAKGPGNIGRPVGAKSRHQRDFSALIVAMIPRAAQKLSDALDNSEPWAVQAIIKLALPSGLTIAMHGVEPADVESALASGDISSEQAKAMIANKKDGKAINELDEHRAMMSEILEKLPRQ